MAPLSMQTALIHSKPKLQCVEAFKELHISCAMCLPTWLSLKIKTSKNQYLNLS